MTNGTTKMIRGTYSTKNAEERRKLREYLIAHEMKRYTGAQKITAKNAPVVAVIAPYQKSGKYVMTIWIRTAAKPASSYLYRTRENAFNALRETIEHEANRKAKTRTAAKAADHWQIGDVFYNSWGYDQTNIDWYQITGLTAKAVKIRPIAGNSNDHGGPYGGKTQPDRYNFKGPEQLKVLRPDGSISMEFGCATKWDGKAKYCSSYH